MGWIKWVALPVVWLLVSVPDRIEPCEEDPEILTTGAPNDSVKQQSENRVPKWARYKSRYVVKDVLSKITDNYGNGFEDLYGTRNMRTILHGAAYRGGANNYFHRTAKRDNHNPLPDDGLKNLCEEGFSKAIYLYRTNFPRQGKTVHCDCKGKPNTLTYEQLDYSNDEHISKMFGYIHSSATNDSVGPVYLHCWNGWHASGQIAALSLRQFCTASGEKAVKYWVEGTDGASNHPSYNRIKTRIRNFSAKPELQLSDSTRSCLCPDMSGI